MKKLMVVLGAALAAGLAFADDFTWVGPNFGDYNALENWQVNGETATVKPGKNDRVIFNPGTDQTLTVSNNLITSGSTAGLYIRDVAILSGTVNLLSSAGYPHIMATDGVTNTLYVAEGAVFSTNFRYVNTDVSADKGVVCKTGKGTANFSSSAWSNKTSTYRVDTFIIDEGLFSKKNLQAQNANHWIIQDGGEYSCLTYSHLKHHEVFTVEKGGKVTLDENTMQYYFSGLEGAGTYVVHAASGSPVFSLGLKGGPYRFTGTFGKLNATWCFCNYLPIPDAPSTEEEQHFPIAAAQQYDIFSAYWANIPPEFDPGIGEFWLPPLLTSPGIEFVTADTDGEPITLHANIYSFSTCDFNSYVAGLPVKDVQVAITGPGDWWPRSGTVVVTGDQVRVTGKVGVPAGATLQFGNGTDAAADFTSFPFNFENKGTLTFMNVETPVAIARPFRNEGTVNVKVPTVLSNFVGAAGSVVANGTVLTLAGSSMSYAPASVSNGGNLVFDGPEVFYGAAPTVAANVRNTFHETLKTISGRDFPVGSDDSLVTATNGAALYFAAGAGTIPPNILLADGGTIVMTSCGRLRGGTTAVRTCTLDGGRIDVMPQYTTYEGAFCDGADPNPNNIRLCVGPKGGVLGSRSSRTGRYASAMTVNLDLRVESGVAAGEEDGGLAVDCGTPFVPTKPWSLTGPVVAGDAMLTVRKAWYDLLDNGKLFGSGDFVMGTGAWLCFAEKDAEIAPRLAWGDGKKLIVRGAARLDMDLSSGSARTGELMLTVGPDGATESSLAADKFGVLQLVGSSKTTVLGDKFKMTVNGGVDRFADGRTKIPVVWQVDNKAGFVTADESGALAPFENYETMKAAEADSTVAVAGADRVTLEAGTKQIGALRVTLNDSNTKNVTISDGATLKIGNGTDAAPVVFELQGSANRTYVPFDGAGAIDFGTSPGLFVIPQKSNQLYTRPLVLTARLSGQNGVAYISGNSVNNADTANFPNTVFTVSATNDYTGGTVIDMASVKVTDKDALSTGDVTVKGSRLGGGAVVFSCEGPFANNFTIGRFGRRLSLVYSKPDGKDGCYPESMTWEYMSHGALEFEAVGTRITGNVNVREHSRISSYHPADGTEVAIFEGIVSGDRLEIVDSCPNGSADGLLAGHRHKFVFCRDNTITGGVEVLNGATAVLRGANPSLGTGTITLADAAALCFENTAELDFTNKLYGAGTIQLGATKEVHFNGDISEFEGMIDLCGLRHEFSKVPPFAFVNTTGRATVAFKGGLGTVDVSALELTGEAKGYNLEIGAGTVLDLGGKTLTVRRLVAGEMSQVVNGELVETNPKLGLSLIVR